MKSVLSRIREFIVTIPSRSKALWVNYRSLSKNQQIAIAAGLALLLLALIVLANLLGGKDANELSNERTVTLASVSSLSGNGDSVNIIGTVRSLTEANILAQNGGTVRSVRTKIGASVPGGFVIAELENAAERASVLQAEGAYDSAVAARAAVSPRDANTAVRNTYRSAYAAVDIAAETQVDTLFGAPTANGPDLLIKPSSATPEGRAISRARQNVDAVLDEWRAKSDSAATADPESLLTDADVRLRTISDFLSTLSVAANVRDSRATEAQLTALAAARGTVNAQIAAIASARETYRSRSVTSTASVDASVKQALGALRAAQANLERTIVRAPIGGTVNFLPIRVGDYVTPLQHVATVAQNGALEIITYVSEENRELLSVGSAITVEENYSGIITAIAPALDPKTKQIEVRIAVEGASELVNGQSVRIGLPNTVVRAEEVVVGPSLLPLASVKLSGEKRFVFTVGEEGRLVAQEVQVGDVRGDRIEVLSGITPEMRIVTDARGLANGEKVRIAP